MSAPAWTPAAAPPSAPAAPPRLQALRAVAVLAQLWLRQARRSHGAGLALGTAAAGLGLGLLASQGAIAQGERIVVDVLLVAQQLVGAGAAVALAVGPLAREAPGSETLAVRPVPWTALFLGRALGLALALMLLQALMGGLGAAGLWLLGLGPPPGYATAVALGTVDLWLLLALALALAGLAAAPLAAAATAVLLFVGQDLADAQQLAAAAAQAAGSNATAALGPRLLVNLLAIWPDFSRLSARPWAAVGLPVPAQVWAPAVLYGLGYVGCCLAVTCLVRRGGRGP